MEGRTRDFEHRPIATILMSSLCTKIILAFLYYAVRSAQNLALFYAINVLLRRSIKASLQESITLSPIHNQAHPPQAIYLSGPKAPIPDTEKLKF